MATNLGNYSVPDEVMNGICVDVGANFGDFTNQYKHLFSKVFFIEPQISLFDKLKNRFSDDEKIVGINAAVWSESDIELTLVSHFNNDFGSVGVSGAPLNSDWTNKSVNTVKSISLDDIFIRYQIDKIDYLKVDCETSEYNFLLNKDLSKIKFIGIELHHQMGVDKYNELLSWIYNTHVVISGNEKFENGHNKEVLFKNKL